MSGKAFKKKFLLSEVAGIGFGFPVAAAYALLLVTLEKDILGSVIGFLIVITSIIFGGIAMPMNFFLAAKYGRLIDRYFKEEFRRDQYGRLLSEISFLPVKTGTLVFMRVGGGAIFCGIYMFFWLHISALQTIIAVSLAVYGSYMAGLVAYAMVTNAVRNVTRDLSRIGILPEDIVREKKYFSLSLSAKMILFLIVPIIFTNLSLLLIILSSKAVEESLRVLLLKAAGVVVVNIFTLSASVFLTFRTVRTPVRQIENALSSMAWSQGALSGEIPTDLSDELAYVIFLMNKAVFSFREILKKVTASSLLLTDSAHDLAVTSQEITTASNEQAAAVKEIVSSMEDSDQLARNVDRMIRDVTSIAQKTNLAVDDGYQRIKATLSKMEEIKEVNSVLADGVLYLNEKIGSIWEIVNIINSVAGQTKIIAFNAELEASAADEAGRNFQIVALEIRRLADNTTSSTEEIKKRIKEIQDSSELLIKSAKQGTNTVSDGYKVTSDLKAVFDNILKSSELSVSSAEQIQNTARQQVSAFEQVLLTLKQISEGINQFVESMEIAAKSTSRLKEMADDLGVIVDKYTI